MSTSVRHAPEALPESNALKLALEHPVLNLPPDERRQWIVDNFQNEQAMVEMHDALAIAVRELARRSNLP